MCRKLQVKLESSSLPNKDDLVLLLHDLAGDEEREDDGTDDWLDAVDKGGLWHMNDQMYSGGL